MNKIKWIGGIILAIYLIFAAYTIRISNCYIKPSTTIKTKVVKLFEQDNIIINQHKSEITKTVDGKNYYLRIYNKKYGYGDLLVETNAYMTCKQDSTYYFTLSNAQLNNTFNTHLETQSILENTSGLVVMFVVIFLILLLIYFGLW